MTPSVIQHFKVIRPSVWKYDFSIGNENGTLASVTFQSAMMNKATIQSGEKIFYIERNAMGMEISVFYGDDEIAVAESNMNLKYTLRFRYKSDKYTFARKSIWKNMEFEWRNEAEQEMVRLKQVWSWFKSEIVIDVNMQLTEGDDRILLPVLGVMIMYYYKAAQGAT